MARFRVPFAREEFGYIYFDAPDEASADVLLAQLERGERDVEELEGYALKLTNGGESIRTWLVEEVS